MLRLLVLTVGIASSGTDGGQEPARPFDAATLTRPAPLTPIDWTYPEEARRNNPNGAIILKCIITVEGEVQSCEVLKSLPGVTEWAIEKLQGTRFRPATLDGKPVRVTYVFNIRVRLSNQPKPKVTVPHWRLAPSPDLARQCAGANGPVCRDAALALLNPDGGVPNFEGASRALTAACDGGFQEACNVLDRSFMPPRLISGVGSGQPTPGPGAEGTVVCRITVEGKARKCQGPGGPSSDWFVVRMLEAKFLPATYEGTPFETDHGIHYSFGSRR